MTDSSGIIQHTIRHTPFGDEVDIRSTLSKLEKAVDDVEIIDTANTTAAISDGKAIPVKTIQTVEKVLYSSDETSSILDPHFVTVQQYTYDYTDTDVLQLKVISSISSAGSSGTVEKTEYIDLTDKALGQYQIALDLRKDVGTDTPTESQKFAVYVSKIRAYTASRIQTVEIPVTDGANAFILSEEGTGLANIAWVYSKDGGDNWTKFTAGDDVDLNGATSIILRATLTPGDELPTLVSFKVTFISVESDSEDYVFTGKEKDASGLYYFGARYYDPEVGEFILEDPGKDGGDWYEYCRANPLKYVDPDGKYPWDAHRVVTKYHDQIIAMAYKYNISPTLLASVVYNENVLRTPIHEFKDMIGIVLANYGADVSTGLCQVQISTAIMLEMNVNPKEFARLTREQREKIKDDITIMMDSGLKEYYLNKLANPLTNLEYAARYLAFLREARNYESMELWLSDYNRGLSNYITIHPYSKRYKWMIKHYDFYSYEFVGSIKP